MRIECRSVMYYYETGHCILNREMHRSTAPTLFTNDTQFQLVDYFENNCFDGSSLNALMMANKNALVSCFENAQMHWIKAEDFHISAKRDILLNGLSGDECRQACMVGGILELKIT